MRKICIIFNPVARSGRAMRVLHQLKHQLRECSLWPTESASDAQQLARRAIQEDFDIVVAAGSDGTINEIVNGLALARAASSPVLGILPLGTVNVFARELGIPLCPSHAWAVILQERKQTIDLLRANHRWFVQMAGVGLDARISQATPLALKEKIGFLAYALTGLLESMRPAPKLAVSVADQMIPASSVFIGNGQRYAGWFPLFPQARLNDDIFDVCVWQGKGLWATLRFAWRALRGSHIRVGEVQYFTTTRLRVEAVEATVPFEVDGEVVGQTPVEFSIHPGALRVIIP